MSGLIEFSGETGAEILRVSLLLLQHGYRVAFSPGVFGRPDITILLPNDTHITLHANPDLAAGARHLARAAHLLGVSA